MRAVDYTTINRALSAVRTIEEEISLIYEEEKAVEPPDSLMLALLAITKFDLHKPERDLRTISNLGRDDYASLILSSSILTLVGGAIRE